MLREGHRCILSRFMDTEYYLSPLGSADTAEPRTTTMLELCHIFSESTNSGLEHIQKASIFPSHLLGYVNRTQPCYQKDYAVNAWSVLRTFGYTQIVEDFASAAKVHSLDNVMIMDGILHHYFDTLKLWFEPVEVRFVAVNVVWPNLRDVQGTQHCYRVVRILPLSQYNLPDVVEFTSHEPDLPLPLPNGDYLRIHAACCRVSWLSGATGLFDRFQRDMEEDPDAVMEAPAFVRSLHARLEYFNLVEAH